MPSGDRLTSYGPWQPQVVNTGNGIPMRAELTVVMYSMHLLVRVLASGSVVILL